MNASDPFSLRGRVALVPGSTTGLGKSMALALGRAGAKVALNYHNNAARAEQGLLNAGLRPVFAFGYFAAPADDPHFTSHAMRLDDSRRVARDLAALPGDLVTMGISLTEPGLVPFAGTPFVQAPLTTGASST